MSTNLRIDGERLLSRLAALSRIGATPEGGCRRLALTDEDREGRDWLVGELKALGLDVRVDAIGNIIGIFKGQEDGPAVIMGSHIDTVGTGGRFDGALGVIGGVEVLAALRDAGVTPKRDIAVIAFTNEEGARFHPDMLGSYVWAGGMSVEAAHAELDSDGVVLGSELNRIGYHGPEQPGFLPAHAYLELHIEQGPVLESEGGGLGAVTGIQAICWLEVTLTGRPSHAGTTPMRYRKDPGLAAARINIFANELTKTIPGQLANSGVIRVRPGNVNVVPETVVMTLDLRNPLDAPLAEAEAAVRKFCAELSARDDIAISFRDLARFPATPFAEELIASVEASAAEFGLPIRRMISGAGHDAQMMSRLCPTAMVFIRSIGGLSHNPAELSSDDDMVAGANVLLKRRLARRQRLTGISPMTTIASLSAAELGDLYAARELSPVEVAKDALVRIERFEPEVNAFVVRDEPVTLAMAQAAEARWLKGEALGPLDGVPVTIKDNLGVAGWPMRRGSAIASDTPFQQDAPATARLREAGCVFLGKTTMPEYGWKGVGDSPLSGITRNPWDVSTGPGGSSSGAAVAAALNLGCIHLGTDGAGSVRIPAAFCGVFGLKPTYGRVPAWPASVMGFLAHLGPLTRTVRDSALAMNAIGRPDARDMTAFKDMPPDFTAGLDRGVRGLRIAWSARLGGDALVDPEIAALTHAAALTFRELGATVEEVDPGFDDPIATLTTLWSAGAALALHSTDAAGRAQMDPGLVAAAEIGEAIDSAAYVDALLYQRNALAYQMAQFHERFDLLLTPTLPLPAFAVGRNTPEHGGYGEDWTRWTPMTYPFNITQQPAAAVPCGLTSAGLPASLQIVGAFGNDALVMQAAAAFETARPFARVDAPIKSI